MADQITIELGIVGIKNMGEYNPETHYEKLNVVTYNGSSYCAKQNVSGILPTNADYWQLYAEKGDKGDTGNTGASGYTPIKGTDYFTEADINEIENDLASNITSEVSTQLSDLTSATPLVASSSSDMTDTSRIYVLVTDGHWYWHNGTSWQDGGAYQAEVSDAILDDNSTIFNNDEISARGIKLYGRTLTTQNIMLMPNARVNYNVGHYSYVTQIEKNKYYCVKKSNTNQRFRVGLMKEAPPVEALSEPLPIAKIIADNNDGTICSFYSEDYNYLIVYVGQYNPANTTCTLYEETTANQYDLFMINDNKDKFEKEITDDLLYNYNEESLWEIGGINSATGEETEDAQFIRTKDYIDSDTISIIRDLVNSNVDTGIRLYNLDNTFNSSLLKYSSTYNNPTNTNKFKIRLVVRKTTGSIEESEIAELCSTIKLMKKAKAVPASKGINSTWDKWNDVRYSYGFDTNKTPIYNEVKGPFETDTMFSVKGGKGRWSKQPTWKGGHVFEGWSKNDLSRVTMLIGKQHQMMSDIFVYSPAGLYEQNRRFGWVKLGSDENNKGADFGEDWVKFYGYITLKNVSTAPTSVIDADLNPQLSDYTNSVPKGTMYYDTSVNKVRVMTNNGWKYLKFED